MSINGHVFIQNSRNEEQVTGEITDKGEINIHQKKEEEKKENGSWGRHVVLEARTGSKG